MVTMVSPGLISIIILIIAGLAVTPGCDRQPAGAALKAGLPPLPPADTRALEPAVREQFRVAREALAASPTSPEANGALGMLFHAYNWLEHAQACYRRAAILEPRAFRWWYCLGRVLMETGQRDEGIDTLRRAIALKDDYAPAALFLGE